METKNHTCTGPGHLCLICSPEFILKSWDRYARIVIERDQRLEAEKGLPSMSWGQWCEWVVMYELDLYFEDVETLYKEYGFMMPFEACLNDHYELFNDVVRMCMDREEDKRKANELSDEVFDSLGATEGVSPPN